MNESAIIIAVLLLVIAALAYFIGRGEKIIVIKEVPVEPKPTNDPNDRPALYGQRLLSKEQDVNTPNPNKYQAPDYLSKPADVGDFYNRTTDMFLEIYGDVIQAYRTFKVEDLLDYQIQSIGFEPNWRVLDAGCGICGPAVYFAKNAGVNIEALTISEVQAQKAGENIRKNGLTDKVRVQVGDYHKLPEIFERDSFDAVYFLESFGHANDQRRVIDSAWDVLKPGGTLYIKDLFKKEPIVPEDQAKIDKEAKNINVSYHYNVCDLYDILYAIRKRGFILASVKTIDLNLEDFENLTISNVFQNVFNIGKVENWEEYILPVDFFEIKCYKPWFDNAKGRSQYFMTRMYYLSRYDQLNK